MKKVVTKSIAFFFALGCMISFFPRSTSARDALMKPCSDDTGIARHFSAAWKRPQKRNKQEAIMALPIFSTPTLTGNDAKRFIKRMMDKKQRPVPVSVDLAKVREAVLQVKREKKQLSN